MPHHNESDFWRTRCADIELLVLDVDGVLTDGRIIIDDHGVESKNFSVRDGTGLELWRRAGKRAAILSGRSAPVVERRGAELAIDPVLQGVRDKRAVLLALMSEFGLQARQVCFIGDDLPDLPAIRIAGASACPCDAAPEVRAACHFTTAARGGFGAVREVIESILRSQVRWDALLADYE